MTITDPTLAAAIAAKGVPLSADHAPQPAAPRWQQARTELIRSFYAYMPVTGAKAATDLLDEAIAEALLKGTAEIERLRGELAAAQKPHTPRLCLCGHSHLAHTVPAPHSCFAYGQTCPCPQYRQLLPDEAMAQLELNRRAAAERARYDDEEAGR